MLFTYKICKSFYDAIKSKLHEIKLNMQGRLLQSGKETEHHSAKAKGGWILSAGVSWWKVLEDIKGEVDKYVSTQLFLSWQMFFSLM